MGEMKAQKVLISAILHCCASCQDNTMGLCRRSLPFNPDCQLARGDYPLTRRAQTPRQVQLGQLGRAGPGLFSRKQRDGDGDAVGGGKVP